MKNKTQTSLQFLEQALAYMPGDNALGTARVYMARAIEEIARVEKKRGRRLKQENVSNQWKYDDEAKRMLPPMDDKQRKNVLTEIDRMIQVEKDKLNKSSADPSDNQQLLG
ncbi:MAG: hypothetical protein ACW99G_00390 [Candidatus Thorarchaeota archaeon]|jgi:hypothetical protein